jgi:hypothetical protein
VTAEENVKAETAAFATFSPFKSRLHRYWEWFVLKAAPRVERQVRAQDFLHYAFFVRLPPKVFRQLGISDDRLLSAGAFLFLSAFNGDAQAYFRGFSEKLSPAMNDLWSTSVGWRDAARYENLDRFIRTYRRYVTFHYTAYQDSSKRVRAALKLRAHIDRLARAAVSPEVDDAAFRRAYDEVVQTVWGNAKEGTR